MGFLEKIIGMTYERKKALNKLDDLQLQIAWYLFLVAHYPHDDAMPHWVSELRSWNRQLRLYNKAPKPRKANYTRAMLWKSLWSEPLGGDDERREFAAQISEDKKLPLAVPNEAALKSVVTKFIDAILDTTAGRVFTL